MAAAATRVISSQEYQQLVGHDYAGPASSLERGTVEAFARGHSDWDGKHWMMHAADNGGTTLSPVNVTAGGALEQRGR
ncbi:hypothetical protein A5658_03400 [Mycobacterium sp. 1245111.1]|uniref:hypothetical protein n=1 Tax=Mycobacterium sp. 1245111.1 TaxID=1834073 RepID=UPI00080090F3|nr:hypothetical protein [Mycobacterium sp. 1245111.1]OBK38579.1 hypothetical protein A5658_03400 [Mycobacterium sp. 1245111.1]